MTAARAAVPHAMTVDFEDWYHVENLRGTIDPATWDDRESRLPGNTHRLLELFGRHGIRATFFCLGRAAEREPGLVRAIAEAGHEIGCHGWSHDLVYRQDPALFREELRRAKGLLEDLAGAPVIGHRASTFSITERSLWALDILVEEGFSYDSSIAPVRHGRYGMEGVPSEPHVRSLESGAKLLEFPVSYGHLLGRRYPLGGGFFRLFPLSFTRRGLRRYEARGNPATIYVHPWEIDPDQPRVGGIPLASRFRHYANLSRTYGKLERLIAGADFAAMADVLAERLDGREVVEN